MTFRSGFRRGFREGFRAYAYVYESSDEIEEYLHLLDTYLGCAGRCDRRRLTP